MPMTCPQFVANQFNKLFVSIGKPLSKNQVDNVSTVLKPTINTIFLKLITEKDMNNLIRRRPNKYSYGDDEIPTILIKPLSRWSNINTYRSSEPIV